MSIVHSIVHRIMNWIAANAIFSWILPDSVELIVYAAIALYLAVEIAENA
jgi:hypothetical protein